MLKKWRYRVTWRLRDGGDGWAMWETAKKSCLKKVYRALVESEGEEMVRETIAL